MEVQCIDDEVLRKTGRPMREANRRIVRIGPKVRDVSSVLRSLFCRTC